MAESRRVRFMREQRCEWEAAPGDDKCEGCHKPIEHGLPFYFVPDGGYSPDGTYIGPCCLDTYAGSDNG